MLTRMLWKAVQADPAKLAIVQGSNRIRYEGLHSLAGRSAAGLRRLGVTAGDCVAVVLPNCPELVASLFACARLRSVMLPLDSQYSREELRRFVVDTQAKVVITDSSSAALFSGTNAIVIEFESLLGYPADPIPEDEYRGPVLYLYTSGSTDSRKRLRCTQENLYYEAYNFAETVGLTPVDNILCTIPLYHSYGIGNCVLDAVYVGATLVLLETDNVPFAGRCGRVLELIREESIRFYPGVPHQFQILAALSERLAPDLAGLRLCVSSGDVLPRDTYERFLERFKLPIRSLYGSTEAGSISINTDPAEAMQFGSLGLPLKNVEVRIRDAAGDDLAADEIGQIWVKSPAIPPDGYDNRPDLTAQVFRDGFYNTGDLGKKDARGHLVMTGRKQTFVDVGGHKVDVREVEEVIEGHPLVREAAALGVEIPNLGTVLKVVVVTHAPCNEAEILAYCRQRLAPFKIPRLVEFRDALPRSPIGKVQKSELGDVTTDMTGDILGDFANARRNFANDGRARQIEILSAQIRQQAARILQLDAESIERSASFQSMGFDSLRSAELYERLVMLTGLRLPITMLWNYPSIDEFAAALWTMMNAQARPAVEPVSTKPLPTNLDDLLSEIERLSDAEVDESLQAK